MASIGTQEKNGETKPCGRTVGYRISLEFNLEFKLPIIVADNLATGPPKADVEREAASRMHAESRQHLLLALAGANGYCLFTLARSPDQPPLPPSAEKRKGSNCAHERIH